MLAPKDYLDLFNSCVLSTEPTRVLDLKAACKVIINNELTYWGVEKSTGVPWLVVAVIHYRESSQNFKMHLHNGDPLTARTVHVPAGRPVQGNPPFTWSQSAVDALTGRTTPFAWDIGGVLEFCERYNGLGYQKHGINSPYVWGSTDKYTSGIFVADGTLDMARKDPRAGVASLLLYLRAMGVPLEFKTGVAPNSVVH